jgi:tetratricopeptide (TPR) repeat protein
MEGHCVGRKEIHQTTDSRHNTFILQNCYRYIKVVQNQKVVGQRTRWGLNAMRMTGRFPLLFLACFLCVPSHSSAQALQSGNIVSLRQLTIPAKASHAFEQGMERLAKKDPGGSLPYFQRAILEYSGYYEAYDRIGAADLKLWRIDDAEQAFRKSIEVSAEQFAHPLLALGSILDSQKKFAEAESVIRKGLDLDPASWTGHYYLGMALFGLNRMEEAEKAVRESLLEKVEFPEAHLLLADIHSRQADYRSLISDLTEYLKLVPDGEVSARAKALRESAEARLAGEHDRIALAVP